MKEKELTKEIKIIIIALLAILACSSIAFGLTLLIQIVPVVSGYVDYLDYAQDINNSFQKITINWQNSGSVGCNVQVRANILHEGIYLYTAWSNAESIYPGGYNLFEIYYYDVNGSGNYSAELKIYMCDEIFEGPKINFMMAYNNSTNLTETIAKSRNDIKIYTKSENEKITVDITSKKNISNFVMFPQKSLPGWRIPAVHAGNISAGETKTIVLNYKRNINEEARVYLALASPNDNIYTPIIVDVKKEMPKQNIYYSLFIVSFAANIVLLVLLKAYMNKKKGEKAK